MKDDIKWITVNGVHVPIMPEQDKAEAVKNFFEVLEIKNSVRGLSVDELREILSTSEEKKHSNKRKINISADHYSRLLWMWGQYHRGESKPIHYKGHLLFSVDKSVYFIRDNDYANFHIAEKRSFVSHAYAIAFLKEANKSNG